jgi:hypothetical protein
MRVHSRSNRVDWPYFLLGWRPVSAWSVRRTICLDAKWMVKLILRPLYLWSRIPSIQSREGCMGPRARRDVLQHGCPRSWRRVKRGRIRRPAARVADDVRSIKVTVTNCYLSKCGQRTVRNKGCSPLPHKGWKPMLYRVELANYPVYLVA